MVVSEYHHGYYSGSNKGTCDNDDDIINLGPMPLMVDPFALYDRNSNMFPWLPCSFILFDPIRSSKSRSIIKMLLQDLES